MFFFSTTTVQGKVHNPTGEGVAAVSAEVKKKMSRHMKAVSQKEHETVVKEEGSARRNITRKKGGNESAFDGKKKKQGGAG